MKFTNQKTQSVTFTTCDSCFDTELYLMDERGELQTIYPSRERAEHDDYRGALDEIENGDEIVVAIVPIANAKGHILPAMWDFKDYMDEVIMPKAKEQDEILQAITKERIKND